MPINSAQLLKSAVHQHAATTRQGVLERVFTYYFDGLVYNQIWEDPRVDLAALELRSDSRVLTISSGGCNILNYLTALPHAITAVDLNRHHMYLTRLKLAALEHLPDYEAFFAFFGKGSGPQNVTNYYRFLHYNLDPETAAYWGGAENTEAARKRARIQYFARNFYDYGRNGYYLRFLHRLARMMGKNPGMITSALSEREQELIFKEMVAPFFDNWFVKFLSKLPFIVFGLGIPPRQYEALAADAPNGDVLGMYRERMRKLACGFPIKDNYFAWQAFGRQYDCERKQALPDYLKEEYYDLLRANLWRVDTEITTLTGFLRQQPAESFDRFVFLDAQDWMKPEEITDLWHEVARVGRPGSRIIFRTAPAASPIEAALPVSLRKRFQYDGIRSRELFDQDRASIYGGFHLYQLM
ncbi:MAG: DUF3419 family protein [Blastocatellia bacterium]|nr:DUF3419 family protein [Blastocatellia bacterium]